MMLFFSNKGYQSLGERFGLVETLFFIFGISSRDYILQRGFLVIRILG